jgi:hypothetical protein
MCETNESIDNNYMKIIANITIAEMKMARIILFI